MWSIYQVQDATFTWWMSLGPIASREFIANELLIGADDMLRWIEVKFLFEIQKRGVLKSCVSI